jgi:hypothetical protein
MLMFVIPSKRSLRREGPERAARCVALFATQQTRVRLASLQNITVIRPYACAAPFLFSSAA